MITFFRHCYRYLLISITICFATGICSGLHNQPLPYSYLLPLLSSFIAFIFFVIGQCRSAAVILCFSFFSLGLFASHTTLSGTINSDDIRLLVSDKQEAVVIGTVEHMVTGDRQSFKTVLDLSFYRTEEMVHFTQVSGKILISLKGEWPQHIIPGDTVSTRAFLKSPSVINTPGVFNYQKYLARKNIHITGFISSPLLIKKTVIPGQYPNLSHSIERLRTTFAKNINRLESREARGLYRAILLGDRSGVSVEIIDNFKRTGILHILAIICEKHTYEKYGS